MIFWGRPIVRVWTSPFLFQASIVMRQVLPQFSWEQVRES